MTMTNEYHHLVGKVWLTPWKPCGRIYVDRIEPGAMPGDEPIAFGYFVGDHPRGYKDGSPARYYARELTELADA